MSNSNTIKIRESVNSTIIKKEVTSDHFNDSPKLVPSQKEEIDKNGVWDAYYDTDGEEMVIMKEGDRPIATGMGQWGTFHKGR